MKILIISDIHGDQASVKRIIKAEQPLDAVLHGGDQESYPDYGVPFFSIAGNHEDFTLLDAIRQGSHTIPNWNLLESGKTYYITDGTERVSVLGIGGNFSLRYSVLSREDIPPHRQRHFSKDEIDSCMRADSIDIFLSHEASPLVSPRGHGIIETIIQQVNPVYAFSGHHHWYEEVNKGGTTRISLARPSYNYVILRIKDGQINHEVKFTPSADFQGLRNFINSLAHRARPLPSPPAWGTLADSLDRNGFYLYDTSTKDGDQPTLILLGELHKRSNSKPGYVSNTGSIATALQECAGPGDRVISEGKNRTVLPSTRAQYHPYAGFPDYLNTELFTRFKECGVLVDQRDYSRASTFSKKLNLLLQDPFISPLFQQRAWQGFFDCLQNRELHWSDALAEPNTRGGQTYGVLGLAHLIYPALRHHLRTKGVKFAAYIPKQSNPDGIL